MASEITSLTIVYSIGPLPRRRSKKASKLRVTGLCARNSPMTCEFPAQRASNAENASIDDVIMMLDTPRSSPDSGACILKQNSLTHNQYSKISNGSGYLIIISYEMYKKI